MSVILTHGNIREAARVKLDEAQQQAEPRKAPVHAATQVRVDDRIDRILKLIPGEAAAAYTVACGLAKDEVYLPIAAFVLSTIVLTMTIRKAAANMIPPVKPEPRQYVLRFAAFVAWAFSIENPIGHWVKIPDWIPMLGVLFIPILGTFFFEDDMSAEAHSP